jgi:hypothetical protein
MRWAIALNCWNCPCGPAIDRKNTVGCEGHAAHQVRGKFALLANCEFCVRFGELEGVSGQRIAPALQAICVLTPCSSE